MTSALFSVSIDHYLGPLTQHGIYEKCIITQLRSFSTAKIGAEYYSYSCFEPCFSLAGWGIADCCPRERGRGQVGLRNGAVEPDKPDIVIRV